MRPSEGVERRANTEEQWCPSKNPTAVLAEGKGYRTLSEMHSLCDDLASSNEVREARSAQTVDKHGQGA